MGFTSRNTRFITSALLAGALLIGQAIGMQSARAAVPANIGRGLQRLVELYRQSPAQALREMRAPQGLPTILMDRQRQRPLVDVYLNGRVPLKQAVGELQSLGFAMTATNTFRKGVIEGYLPLDRALAVAAHPAVRSLSLQFQPARNVGLVTSEAVPVQGADAVQALGIYGTGIKVGVLSDSYASVTTSPTAADDIATFDLPGDPANPFNTTPVAVLEDLAPGTGSDEGRAMLQLVTDLAPAAKLGFATAFNGEIDFANNIVALRTSFGADVIVDDVVYFDEPFYSEGIVAQAVDQAVSLGAAYFSSAGNNGRMGYESTYRPVGRKAVALLAALGKTNLKLATVPASLAQSFHDFDPGPKVDVLQTITVGATAGISFQWNEPFNTGGVETDYNFLIFNTSGRLIRVASGTDDNLSTDQPVELTQLPAGTYQIAVARANSGPANVFKWVAVNTLVDAEYMGTSTPTVFGHTAALGGLSVAATFFDTVNSPEDFTALGPVTYYFDTGGNPLGTPFVQQVPQVTGTDGTSTTFFFGAPGANGFPHFFGTSAGAPNVAGVAALVLEAAGGPGSLTPAAVYSALQTTATDLPFDTDPFFSQVAFNSTGVSLKASGDSGTTPNFFTLALDSSVSGKTITQVTIDTSSVGIVFDPDATTGLPFTLGTLVGVSSADVSASVSPTVLSVTFAPGSFGAGDSVGFGIDRDYAATFSSGNSPDLLPGALVTVTFSDGSTATGTFQNTIGAAGFDNVSGFGLVNALGAVNSVR